MHSTVYEISERPIPVNQQITPGYLPDWFFNSICSYATKMSAAERESSIRYLVKHFGGLCDCNGDQIVFSPLLKQQYFKEKYEAFKAAAQKLAETEYAKFAGILSAETLRLTINSLMGSYADQYGVYIYESGKLLPLDDWIRKMETKTSKTFYVGGTVWYHF